MSIGTHEQWLKWTMHSQGSLGGHSGNQDRIMTRQVLIDEKVRLQSRLNVVESELATLDAAESR